MNNLWEEYLETKWAQVYPEKVTNFWMKDHDALTTSLYCFLFTAYFEKYPKRSKMQSDAWMIKNEPELVEDVRKFAKEYQEEVYCATHERYMKVMKKLTELSLPASSGNIAHVVATGYDHTYMSQVASRKYAIGQLEAAKVLFEFFGYSTEIRENNDGASLWADIPELYKFTLADRVKDGLLLAAIEYRNLWNKGVNPKVLYPFISGYGNFIDFVCDHRTKAAEEIVEIWRAK